MKLETLKRHIKKLKEDGHFTAYLYCNMLNDDRAVRFRIEGGRVGYAYCPLNALCYQKGYDIKNSDAVHMEWMLDLDKELVGFVMESVDNRISKLSETEGDQQSPLNLQISTTTSKYLVKINLPRK